MLRLRALGLAMALGLAVAATGMVMTEPAHAQSAADKATARQLATKGIGLFKKGDFAGAVDKLERAQSLYDAPVHLLYLGRAYVKLNKLVDGAEAYRKLIRSRITADSPQAFRDAVVAGQAELPPIEPQIPSLRIDVKPEGIADLEITIDGKPVPAAVVGIERPANPGDRVIKISAPGYKPLERTVTLAVAQELAVPFELERDESVPVPVVGAPGPDGDTTGSPGDLEPSEPVVPGKFGVLLGVRGGAGIPGGDAIAPDGSSQELGDIFKPGGGASLYGGLRMFKYFTVVAFYERYILGPGVFFDRRAPPAGAAVTTTAFSENFGFSFLVGTPRGRIGGFGEIGITAVHRFVATSEGANQVAACDNETTYTGTAGRIGGGGTFPIWRDVLNLSPFITLTLGNFSDIEVTQRGDACLTLFSGITPEKRSLSGAEKKSHTLLLVGVGGDFTFGGDSTRPR